MAGYLPRNHGNRSGNRIGSTVSRRLGAAEWNISPSGNKFQRPGIYVSAAGDLVSILVDLDNHHENRVAAAGILAEVWGWEQVSDAEGICHNEDGSWSVRFTYTPVHK